MEDIVIQHSDTQGTPFGYGSYGSRTSSVGGTAAVKAAGKIREKARRYAAHMLEASVDDIEVDGANYSVKGSPDRDEDDPGDRVRARPRRSTRRRAWSRISTRRPTTTRRTARGRSGPTSPSSRSTRRPVTWISTRYVAVDDVGKKINPMIVDGQIHGGIAQGVGQALWEGAIYDDRVSS